MTSILLKILMHRRIAPVALRVAMRLHGRLYDLCGVLATSVNGGVHPKHRILRYKEWFLDRIEPGWVVLDVGSNTGAMPALLAQKAAHVYGIEIDPKLSEKARSRFSLPNVEFLTGDATKYCYADCLPVDCVTLSNVLEHIGNRVDFLQRLRHGIVWKNPAQRRFLIRVPAIERDWLSVYKQELGVEYRLDRTHEIEHTHQQLIDELTAAGLGVESFDTRFGEYYVVCHG